MRERPRGVAEQDLLVPPARSLVRVLADGTGLLRRRLAFLLLVSMGAIGCTSVLGDFSVVEPVADGADSDTQEPAVDGASGGDTQTTGDAGLADSIHPDTGRGDAP